MSWHYSRVLVEEYLAENSLDGEPCAPLKLTPMPQAFLSSDRMTAFSRLSRFGMTFAPLMDDLGTALLTSYLAAFHAKTLAQQGKAQGLSENEADYGKKWPASLAKYDRDTSSWRTAQYSLLGGLEPYSGTWPRWGMMQDGVLLELSTPALRTSEAESGLLPTPLASLGTNGGPNQRDSSGRPGLQMAAMMWPTPKATAAGPDFAKMKRSRTGVSLQTAVAMFPTPTASNTKAVHMRGADKGKKRQARSYLPTPTVNDLKNSTLPPSQAKHDNLPGYLLRAGEKPGGQLNPTWVEWLMGWPIGWTDLKPLAMDKFQQWLSSHGIF